MGLYLQCIVRFRLLLHTLSHYVQISSSIHARLFGSVRYCLLIWWGWKPKIYLLSEPPSTLCALGHNNGSNNGSEVCASSEYPDETAFAQARLSCRCSHNILVSLISWHVVGMCFR